MSHDDLAVNIETIASVGPEGKEERDQVVMSFRRALVFCQFYAYGRDLYIGWDGFLNSGCWTEARVARGVSSKSRNRVIVNTVVPGRDVLTEYDLIDLNCVIEWTHTRLVELVKQIASEHKIDQEIDFAIQRANRAALLGSGDGDEKSGTGKRLRKLVRHG